MNAPFEERLRQRHDYESWRDRNTLEEELFIWQFFFAGDVFPGWRVHRTQRVEAAGWPPGIQSIWRPPGEDTQTLLAVDAYECASRAAAHAFLIQLLTGFQSPEVSRQDPPAVGDVVFAVPGETALLFARANLAFLIRSAGRQVLPVTEVARQLDRELTARPEVTEARLAPDIRRFALAAPEIQVGVSVPLEIEASDPREERLWFKFFSSAGQVLLEDGKLVYRPLAAGPQQVTVYVINEHRDAASRVLEIEAK
jgi:hypothetical protein